MYGKKSPHRRFLTIDHNESVVGCTESVVFIKFTGKQYLEFLNRQLSGILPVNHGSPICIIFQLTILKSKGVESIKSALLNAKKVVTPESSIRIYTIGAPRYRIEVDASDYSDAETIMSEAANEAIRTIKELGGEGQQIG